jgi:hypothetical protein
MKAEQDQMEEMWEKKNKQLTDAKDLQVNLLSEFFFRRLWHV